MQNVRVKLNKDRHAKSNIQPEAAVRQQNGLELQKQLVKCCIWSVVLCGAATGTVDRKYFGRFVPVLIPCIVTVLRVHRTNI